MPCKCSGYRHEQCKCKLLGAGFPLADVDGQVMIVTQRDSAFFKHSVVRPPKRNFIVRIVEHVYEKCAGYNLRYCPFRGYVGTSCANEALRDLMILLCFMLANFVVFATIVTRMTMHAWLAIVSTVRWIRRYGRLREPGQILSGSFGTKLIMCNDDTRLICPGQPHDFSPRARRPCKTSM